MNNPHSPALQTALAYYNAWRNRDHDTAMNVVADTVVAETPFGRLEGGAALHESETEFANILTGATLIASFGDKDTALLLYNTHTLSRSERALSEILRRRQRKDHRDQGTVRQERLRGSSRRVRARLASNGASIEVDAWTSPLR